MGFSLAALAPTYWSFAASLAVVGLACLTFVNATNPLMQLSTYPAMRGRVMALRVAIALGGAPIVGWIADRYGPRWAIAVGAAAAFCAALIAVSASARSDARLLRADLRA